MEPDDSTAPWGATYTSAACPLDLMVVFDVGILVLDPGCALPVLGHILPAIRGSSHYSFNTVGFEARCVYIH